MINRALLFAPLLLAGCMGTENRGMESVHQPVVSSTSYTLDLQTTRGALVGGEPQRLAGWLAGMRLRYGDQVAIDDPTGAGYTARGQVAAVVGQAGLLLSDVAPVTAGQVAPGTVRVVLSRMHADVPGCPDWTRNSSNEFDSNVSSNYGCAANRNLAAMVANPADLVSGARTSGVNDPAVSTRAIQSFRKATPTGAGGTAIKTESTGGK